MEMPSGSNARTGLPLLTRVIALGVSVAAVAIAFATYVPADIGRIYPPANIIANTWYGPALILLVPVALGWLAVGIRRRWLRVLTVCLAILLLLGCLDWIYVVREMSGTVPEIFRRDHVM